MCLTGFQSKLEDVLSNTTTFEIHQFFLFVLENLSAGSYKERQLRSAQISSAQRSSAQICLPQLSSVQPMDCLRPSPFYFRLEFNRKSIRICYELPQT